VALSRTKQERGRCKPAAFLILLLSFMLPSVAFGGSQNNNAAGQYLSVDEFLQLSFGSDAEPNPAVYWLPADVKERIKALNGRDFPLLRVRYWAVNNDTAWILEEIGKEMPITIGVLVDGEENVVRRVEVLAFRESRGWEVRHPFFTRQFNNISLNKEDLLSEHIDGITGATLSVRAVKHVTQVALILANAVQRATSTATSE
jgi:hypothetical protein